MATTRKALSKKTRFDVFKRDSFVCQYCGEHPPSVILHVDHIHPVAAGGGNDMDNLITACSACNQGKAANLLADIPQSLQDKAALIIEREAQIKGFQKVLQAKKSRIEDESVEVCEVYETFNPGYTLNAAALVSVCNFIDRLGVHEVVSSMERAFTNPKLRKGQEFKYFCGICWNKIKAA